MVENATEAASGGNWLTRFLSNPIFGMIAWVATVLGSILSVYFYFEGTKRRDLVYFVNPAQAVVVKTGEATNLHVRYGDRELKSDVTAAQIALWNRGNDSIRPENVLEQVAIRTNPPVPILEASVRKRSRGVVDISLDQARLNEGIVGVSWKILEQGDGAVIQLVYAGPPSTQIVASGVIEGQNQIRQLKDRDLMGPSKEVRLFGLDPNKGFGLLMIPSGVIMLIFAFARHLWWRSADTDAHNRWRSRLPSSWVFVFGGVTYTAAGLYATLFLSHPNPPFGF